MRFHVDLFGLWAELGNLEIRDDSSLFGLGPLLPVEGIVLVSTYGARVQVAG